MNNLKIYDIYNYIISFRNHHNIIQIVHSYYIQPPPENQHLNLYLKIEQAPQEVSIHKPQPYQAYPQEHYLKYQYYSTKIIYSLYPNQLKKLHQADYQYYKIYQQYSNHHLQQEQLHYKHYHALSQTLFYSKQYKFPNKQQETQKKSHQQSNQS